jgi:hypothetical protein
MRIEAVVVCVDYADYLAETLPRNLPHFDRVLVITAPHDHETQELCRRLSVPYYATGIMSKDGAKFDKARGIDFGIGFARWNEWLVQLDADTYLPPMTRRWLESRPLDRESVYGIDRVNCIGWQAWKSFLAAEPLQHDYMCRVRMPPFPMLDRIAIRDYGGYLPIGYFQMWHGSLGRRYPIAQGDAEHTDVLHAIQWDEGRRHLIPEVVGIHLMAEPSTLGANWKGRCSPRFGPSTAVMRDPCTTRPYNADDAHRLYMG